MRVIATFAIHIYAPDDADRGDAQRVRISGNLPGMMVAFEEDITKLLPFGWEARIGRLQEEPEWPTR